MEAWQQIHIKTHCFVFFCPAYSFILGEDPSLFLYMQVHDAGCSHRREGRNTVSLYLLQVSRAQAEKAHLAVLPEEHPLIKPLPG